MRLRIKQSRPRDLNEAICHAVELDAFNNAESGYTSQALLSDQLMLKTVLDKYLVLRLWWVKYEKRLLLRCIHHFKSDLINNVDHMRTSGTEPSSVILSQTKKFKPEVPQSPDARLS